MSRVKILLSTEWAMSTQYIHDNSVRTSLFRLCKQAVLGCAVAIIPSSTLDSNNDEIGLIGWSKFILDRSEIDSVQANPSVGPVQLHLKKCRSYPLDRTGPRPNRDRTEVVHPCQQSCIFAALWYSVRLLCISSLYLLHS